MKTQAKRYVLTDGINDYQDADMTQEQLERAREEALIHTDGNVWWEAR